MANLWRGFLSLWVSDVERKNPEIAYENAINSMIEKYSGLKRATAAIIRRREELEQRHDKQAKELAQISADLDTAVETNQDDLALVLIQRKAQLEAEVADIDADMQNAMKDADTAKTSLLQIQSEIKKLKAEKDAMLAKLQSAQARIQIQEQLDGLSVENEVKALDNVRDHIRTTVAQANLEKELGESSLDTKLSQLREKSGEVAARKQLELLKAVAATKALGQKKTL
ncbi:MAG TPA: PspA/IM30 family protein [Polyangiaceae bacterium]